MSSPVKPDNFQTAIGAMGRKAGKRGPRFARKKGDLHLELRATVKVLANAGKNLDEIVELILPKRKAWSYVYQAARGFLLLQV